MTEDKCPFCGAADLGRGHGPEFSCGTYQAHTSGKNGIPETYWDRGKDCYERQLAAQAELLKRALEVVDYATGGLPLEGKFYNLNHPICKKAKALLPDLRRAVEGKP